MKKNWFYSLNSLLISSMLSIVLFSSSCEKQEETLSITQKYNANAASSADIDKLFDAKSNLRREFGKALMVSMKESVKLREVIRKEALKKINYDNDVLYALIKDEVVENGLTVENLIQKNTSNKKLLKELEDDCPTITIFLPELPENSFNATKWDFANEIPKIAIRLSTSNDMPIIDTDGAEYLLSQEYTPGFPVVVLKENEGIISEKEKVKGYDKLKTRSFQNKRGETFRFVDDCYDYSKNKNVRVGLATDFDPKVITAYNTYLNVDGWQRDYIYYNITPNQTRGSVNLNFKEYIKSFRMIGDPIGAFNVISDHTNDPKYASSTRNPSSPWSDGNFDFKVTMLINKKNGTAETINKLFTLNPSTLFKVNYVQNYWLLGWVYKVSSVELLTASVSDTPLFTWDLNEVAAQIKLSFEEVDPSTTVTQNKSVTEDIAANFEGSGTVQKVGLKFGLVPKITITKSHSVVSQTGNDVLGDVLVNFGEKVIDSQSTLFGLPVYNTKEHSTGICSVSIEPRQNP